VALPKIKGQLQLTSVFTTFTFVEREIIEFAPCRLPQEKIGLLIGGKRHGVNPLNVSRNVRVG
jgi:hypothetical protein